MTYASAAAPPPPPHGEPSISGESITWSLGDVLIGIGGFLAAFYVIPALILTPFIIRSGEDGRPTLIVALIVTVFSQLSLVGVAAWRSFGAHGGGWEKLGFRRLRMSFSIWESSCPQCGARPAPKAAFCISCGLALPPSVHAVAIGRVVAWALIALVVAYTVSLGYAGLIAWFDLDWLRSRCDDQIPAEVLNDRLLLALVGISVIGLAPFCEEIFFRGFMFPGFLRRMGLVLAIVLSASLFSSAHLQYRAFVPILGVALGFAFAYYRSGTIYSPMLAHLVFNIIAYTALVTTTCDPDASAIWLPIGR